MRCDAEALLLTPERLTLEERLGRARGRGCREPLRGAPLLADFEAYLDGFSPNVQTRELVEILHTPTPTALTGLYGVAVVVP